MRLRRVVCQFLLLGVTASLVLAVGATQAAVMGVAFGLGALAPILPYLLLPVGLAVYLSILATAGVLFGIGVVKARWTHAHPVASGLEILLIGAFAGIAGFFFGTVLPTLLGAPAAG